MKKTQSQAAPATPLESIAQDLLTFTEGEKARLSDTCFHDLAKCTQASGIPDDLRAQAQQEIASLRRTTESLDAARRQTAQLADELQARMADTAKAVDRKWYKANPPANSAIDLCEEERNFFAKGMNFYKIALVLFIGSFAGVVVELLWCLVRNGYLESRAGLVWGPFNALYGVGAAALSVLLYRFRNRGKWLSFLGGMAIGSAVEYACSWWQEVTFGTRSWDYSNMPFNINGRICLLYSIFWGLLGVLWIKDIYPRMSKWLLKLPDKAGKILTWAVSIFLIVNCLVSGAAVLRWSERQQGLPANNVVEQVLDARFPDERMEKVYANMSFVNE